MEKKLKNNKMYESVIISNQDEDKMQFSGVAVEFGVKTRNETVYNNTTFIEKLPLLYQHDIDDVIGNVSFTKTENKVYFDAKLNPELEKAQDIWKKIKHEDITGVSIGSLVNDYKYDEKTDSFLINESEIIELSVVTVPSARNARIHTFENIKEKEKNMEDNQKMADLLAEKAKLEAELKALQESKVQNESFSEKMGKFEETLKELNNKIDEKSLKLDELSKINEKSQKNKEGNDMMTKSEFLKSEKAVDLYLESFRNVKGRGDRVAEEFSKLLQIEGLTGDLDNLVPDKIAQDIQDLYEKSGKLIPFLSRMTGSLDFIFNFNTNENDGFGWQGESAQKTERVINLGNIKISTQYIYEHITISRENLDQPNNMLYNYIIKTLTENLILTIERAVLVDDGRAVDSSQKIKEIKPISGITDANFVNIYETSTLTGTTLDLADAEITYQNGQTVFVMNKKTYVYLKTITTGDGYRVYERGTVTIAGNIYNTLDGYIIVESEALPAYTSSLAAETVYIIGFKSGAYTLLTYTPNSQMFADFKLGTNTNEYLNEIRIGGNLTKLESAVNVKIPTTLKTVAKDKAKDKIEEAQSEKPETKVKK